MTEEPKANRKKNSSKTTDEEDNQDDEKWKEIVAAIDTNGDGKVSFQEFQKAVDKFLTDGMNVERWASSKI